MSAREWSNRIVGEGEESPDQLLANPANWRIHPEAQQDAMAGALDEVGWVQRVVVNQTTGHIVDGHLRVRLAMRRGAAKIPVLYVTLSEEEERIILATLDTIGAMAVTDEAQLSDLARTIGEVENAALAELIEGMIAEEAGVTGTGGDEPPEHAAPEIPTCQQGDVWQLGDHVLVIGNSLDAKVRQLGLRGREVDCVLTDPPYAIYGSSTGLSSDITDDSIVRPFFENVMHAAYGDLKEFGHCYVFNDWRSWASWWAVAKVANMTAKNLLVWDKKSSGLGSNYANTYELCGFFSKLPKQTAMGDRKGRQRAVLKPNLISMSRVSGDEREHNAQKPVDLFVNLIENSTEAGELVADYFCGSGTVFVAAERAGRVAVSFDQATKWGDVAIGRWQRETEREAVLVADGTGAEWDTPPTFVQVQADRAG